MKKCTSWCK